MHLEFVLPGTPVSSQTRDRTNLRKWKDAVRSAAAKMWTGAALSGKLKLVVIYFHEGDKPPLDDDNMVKPIRDALTQLVYDDDRQIRHSETLHVPIDAPIRIRGASAVLLAGYSKGGEFLYVRVEDAPADIQLPR